MVEFTAELQAVLKILRHPLAMLLHLSKSVTSRGGSGFLGGISFAGLAMVFQFVVDGIVIRQHGRPLLFVLVGPVRFVLGMELRTFRVQFLPLVLKLFQAVGIGNLRHCKRPHHVAGRQSTSGRRPATSCVKNRKSLADARFVKTRQTPAYATGKARNAEIRLFALRR